MTPGTIIIKQIIYVVKVWLLITIAFAGAWIVCRLWGEMLVNWFKK